MPRFAVGHPPQDPVEEDPADHRRPLRELPRLGGETVQARHEQAVERVGHDNPPDRRPGPPAALSRAHEGALLDQAADHLLDVEGVALGPPHHEVPQGLRHLVEGEQPRGHLDRPLLRERRQGEVGEDRGVALPGRCEGARPARLRARHQRDREGQPLREREEVLEQFVRGAVGPVHVLDHQHRRAVRRERREDRLHQGEEPVAQLLRGNLLQQRALLLREREPHQVREDRPRLRVAGEEPPDRQVQPPAGRLLALLLVDPGVAAHQVQEGAVGQRRGEGQAAPLHPVHAAAAPEPVAPLVHQARLADPGLPAHGDDPPPPRAQARRQRLELAQLRFAADEGRSRGPSAPGPCGSRASRAPARRPRPAWPCP